MAQNDYFVIVYKILRYLYTCMQEGKMPVFEDFCWSSELLGEIPETYWNQIMTELINKGYIDDAFIVPRIGAQGNGIKISPSTHITMEGIEFLQDNSNIAKARKVFGKAVELLVNNMVIRLP